MMATVRQISPRVRFAPVLFVLTLEALATWATPLAAADNVADRVIGKPDFFTSGCNAGGISASSLCTPTAVEVDASGNLFVADRGNHRVLVYRSPLTTDLVADLVIGQPDFITRGLNTGGLSASTLNSPTDLTVDAAGNLYVADLSNNRVLEYNTPLTTDVVADRVFGQPDFTTATPNTGGLSASSLLSPSGLAVDVAGNLYVGEFGNRRVVVYESPLTTDAIADQVIGQPDFSTNTSNTGGLSAASLGLATGVDVSADGTLFVSDTGNDRVLAYFTPLTSDRVADLVFGKPDFTTPRDTVQDPLGAFHCATPTGMSLCDNRGLAVDSAGNLYVADSGVSFQDPSSRVVAYQNALTTDSVADQVFGQPGFTDFGCGLGPDRLCAPRGVAVDMADNMYVADTNNSRVLEYDIPPPLHCGGGPGCISGQRCVAGTCICDATSCPTGCCAGLTCNVSSAGSCGTAGATCIACEDGNVCTDDTCDASFTCSFIPNSLSCNSPEVDSHPLKLYGQGRIYGLAFSPTGDKAVIGRAVYDVSTGVKLFDLLGHSGLVLPVAYSADGSKILTGSWDRTARLWDAATGHEIRTLFGHTDIVYSVAFSPDNSQALTGSFDGTAKLWNASTGALIHTIPSNAGAVLSVTFSPDSTKILTGQYSTAKVWDVQTGALIRTIPSNAGWNYAVAFSPDGTTILTGSEAYAFLWSASTGAFIRQVAYHNESVRSVAFSPDGSTILTGSADTTARLWSTATGALLDTIGAHSSWVHAAFSPDGSRILTASVDGTAKLWALADLSLIRTFSGHIAEVAAAALSPDGTKVLTGSYDETARLWDLASEASIATLGNPVGVYPVNFVYAVTFSPDGSTFLTTSLNNEGAGVATLWDTATASSLRTLRGHNGWIYSLAFSPDGTRIVTGSADATAIVWDATTGTPVYTLAGHTSRVNAVAFSPDGRRILTGSGDRTARIWDAGTGTTIRILMGHHTAGVQAVAFSPDGAMAVTGALDNTAKLWDVETATKLRTLGGHTQGVLAVNFSPDGRHVVTGSSDFTAILWDTETGAEERAFIAHDGAVRAAVFSSDGTKLLTASDDLTALIWSSGLPPVSRRPAVRINLSEPVDLEKPPFQYADFRLDLAAGQAANLVVRLTPLEGSGTWSLVGQYGELPTLAANDFASDTRTSRGAVELLIPNPRPGSLLISVYYGDYSLQTGRFRLECFSVDRYLSDVTPRLVGNLGRTTLLINAVGLWEATSFELRGTAGAAKAQSASSHVSATKWTAVFDLFGAVTGTYDLHALGPVGEDVGLDGALLVSDGNPGRFTMEMIHPSVVRAGRQSVIFVEYGNDGGADIAAPILNLSSPENIQMRLSPDGPYREGVIQILGVSFDGAIGILRPGSKYRIPVYFLPPANGVATFDLARVVTDSSLIDWDAVKLEMRPGEIDDDAWTAISDNLVQQIGSTWGDYQRMLTSNSEYLATNRHLEDSVFRTDRIAAVEVQDTDRYDVQALLDLEIARATGRIGPAPVLAANVDVDIPAPGIALAFGRMARIGLEDRFRLGPLGRGWSHIYEVTGIVSEGGEILISGPGSVRRLYVPTPPNVSQAKPADNGSAWLVGAQVYWMHKGLTSSFEPDGRLARIEDTNGNYLTFAYEDGRLTRIGHSNGESLAVNYDPNGRITTLIDASARVTRFRYDSTSEYLTEVDDEAGRVTSYSYLPANGSPGSHALSSIGFPDGRRLSYSFDSRGRLTEQSWGEGIDRLTCAYNADGSVTVTRSNGAHTTTWLDQTLRPTKILDPLGSVTDVLYNRHGNMVGVRGNSSDLLTIAYHPSQYPIAAATSSGDTLRLVDAPGGRSVELQTPNGTHTTYTFDAVARTFSFEYPDGTVALYRYDDHGNVAEYRNRRSQTTLYSRNSRGDVTRRELPEGRTIDYAYDDRGNPVTIVDSDMGTTHLTYDDREFLTRLEYPSGHWFEFLYDPGGRRTQRLGDDGYVVNYQYDVAGRLVRITDGEATELAAYQYDSGSRLTEVTLGSGNRMTYVYDAADRVIATQIVSPSGILVKEFNYEYDALGNRTRAKEDTENEFFTYDSDHQLTASTYSGGWTEAYSYDPLGNRNTDVVNGITRPYVTNVLNQYTQVGDVTFSYDPDGNLVTRTGPDGMTTFEYDGAGQLIRVTSPGGQSVQYSYDALGHRVEVRRNVASRDFVYDSVVLGDLATEYDVSGQLVARYVFGLGPVARIAPSGEASFFLFDGMGNTRLVVDDTGSVENSYEYSPFGKLRAAHEYLPNAFRFMGAFGVWSDETGLAHCGARAYNPDLGRFMQMDPVGLGSGDANPYRYAFNNPTSLVDPFGYTPSDGQVAAVVQEALRLKGGNVHDAMNLVNDGIRLFPAYETNGTIANAEHYLRWRETVQSDPSSFWSLVLSPFQVYKSLGMNVAGAIYQLGKGIKQSTGRGPDLFDGTSPAGVDQLLAESEGARDGLLDFQKPVETQNTEQQIQAVLSVVGSIDPNEKVGPLGFGPAHCVDGGSELTYTIYFENQPSASAPAQEVAIVDDLDSQLDWSSLVLKAIGFGDRIVANTAAPSAFSSEIVVGDYREDVGQVWLVDVAAEMDPATGRLIWTLRTLDPDTSELPDDPLAGFLPPEDGTGRGGGFVTCSVRVREGVPSDSIIANHASIVFDVNAPIVTNEVSNTICGAASGCQGRANETPCDDGDPCTIGDVCVDGSCVGGAPGVCDDANPCTDDHCDQNQSCIHTPKLEGTMCGDWSDVGCDAPDTCNATGQCIPRYDPATATCRPSSGQCDVAESCTGSSGTCPVDGFKSATETCVGTSSGGDCDGTDSCDGAGHCVDGYLAETMTCRPAASDCDVVESCTGSSGTCPVDGFRSATETCVGTSSGGDCDGTDSCDGAGNCVDGYLAETMTCRTAASDCDVAESCTGSSGTCPVDGFRSATETCVGTSSGGDCDGTDSCDGAGNCVDGYLSATTTCRVPASECDVPESCTGTSGACPADNPGPPACNSLTDTEFCQLPNDQFKLIQIQDPCTMSNGLLWTNNYKLNASNPGQFYYNVFDSGTPGDPISLDITIPYPFVSHGATPIQTHDSFNTVGGCFVPSPNLNSMYTITCGGLGVSPAGNEIVLLADYPGMVISDANVAQCHVTGNIPLTGVLYVTVHLDYGLKKGPTGWQQGGMNQAQSTSVCGGGYDGITEITDPQPYSFSYENGSSGSIEPTSMNVFKKNPGTAGLTLHGVNLKPQAGVSVQLVSSAGKVVGTAISDVDGYFQITYQHKGKSADYKVKLPAYGLEQTISLKTKGYMIAMFENLP